MPYETFTHTHTGFASKLLFGLMFIFLLISCQKKEVQNERTIEKESPKLILKNKNDEVLATDVLNGDNEYVICVENYDKKKDRYVVRYFANEAEFENYAAQQPENTVYRKALDKFTKIKELRATATRNGDIFKDDPQLFSNETKQLLEEMGGLQPENSSARGVGLLYDRTEFRGRSYPLIPINPNYRRFRNKAESVRMVGISAVALCDLRWFRGTKIFLFYLPYGSFPDLGVFNFRNKAESNFEVF